MRDGTSLLDQCITSSGGNLSTDSVRDILGLIGQETVFVFMRSIAEGDATAALKHLGDCVDAGLDLQELCVALLEGFRDLMLLAAPGDLSDLLLRSGDEIELMKDLLSGCELPDLVTIVERMCDAAPRLKKAADPRILLESMLVDLALLDRQVDIRRLIADLPDGGGGVRGEGKPASTGPAKRKPQTERLGPTRGGKEAGGSNIGGDKQGTRGITEGPSGSASAAPQDGASPFPAAAPGDSGGTGSGAVPAAQGEAPLDTQKLLEMWDGFVTFVRQKKLRLGVCLFSGKIHSFDGSTIALRFAKSFGVQNEQVAKPENIRFLKRMMARYFGRELDIVCFREGEEQDVRLSQRMKKTNSANDGLRGVAEEKKPLVKKILEEFDGEIIRYNPR
jgi:hypothetical protein